MNQCLPLCLAQGGCTARDHESCVAGYLVNALMRVPRYTGLCTALPEGGRLREECERLESVGGDFDVAASGMKPRTQLGKLISDLHGAAAGGGGGDEGVGPRRVRALSVGGLLLDDAGGFAERWSRTELPKQMMTCIDVMEAMRAEELELREEEGGRS